MKIQYASDLHLEFAENRNFIENGGIMPMGEILVLAGDVSYLGDRKMMKRRFFDWCAEHFRKTFIVPGNHEFITGMTSLKRWRITSLPIVTMCGT
jgi:3',5'-cyclic AMP phosphodiesterase CpdA